MVLSGIEKFFNLFRSQTKTPTAPPLESPQAPPPVNPNPEMRPTPIPESGERFYQARDPREMEMWALWQSAYVLPREQTIVGQIADRIERNRARYENIERATGVPWYAVGCIHMREAWPPFSFKTHLANGQPLDKVTTIVPKGIGPFDTWEQGAEWILRHKKFHERQWHLAPMLVNFEDWNGQGYRRRSSRIVNDNRPIPTPFIWAKTNHQKPGKFVADGKYSPTTMDSQVGVAAALIMLVQRGLKIDIRIPT
jgi:lysozyme family protein